MLKINNSKTMKELAEFNIYPYYNANPNTGESFIRLYQYNNYLNPLTRIFFKKKKRKQHLIQFNKHHDDYFLQYEKFDKDELDIIYDLIKADLVEKVEDK